MMKGDLDNTHMSQYLYFNTHKNESYIHKENSDHTMDHEGLKKGNLKALLNLGNSSFIAGCNYFRLFLNEIQSGNFPQWFMQFKRVLFSAHSLKYCCWS